MNPEDLIQLALVACDLDRSGLFKEADLIDNFFKSALLYQSPYTVAESLYRIIQHLMFRANPERHAGYLQSVRKGLAKINPLELASKNSNPSTGIGAAINVVKNVLIGQHPAVISAVLNQLQTMV